MSSQKRLLLFFLLSFVMVYASQALMERLGLIPPPRPAAQAPAANAQADAANPVAPANPPVGEAKPSAPANVQVQVAKRPEPEAVKLDELVLGADDDPDPKAYHLRVQLDQYGAAVMQVSAARFDGETPDGIPDRRSRLHLIKYDASSKAPLSFAMTLQPGGSNPGGAAPQGEVALDLRRWEAVRDRPGAPVVRPITKKGPDGAEVQGQEAAFRAVDDSGVAVTKRFRLWKGEDGFALSLTFEGSKDGKVAYRLFGPHGIPIEGESYTANFRDVFFGQAKGNAIEVATKTAADVVKAKASPEAFQTLPIRYAGVEDQYFAVFFAPDPAPTSQESRIDAKSMAYVAKENPAATQKSDVGVEMTSIDFPVGPGRPITHDFRVFAGPKTVAALSPYGANDLASYRKYQLFSIPFASSLAQNVISPLLERIYGLTEQVARIFGGSRGSYGIAIILLTMTVRMIMFPLGRKQAMISKKMQELQPHLAAIKEKYKDDKEAQTRAQMALYREHGFNPAAGCLPALVQLPIFVGLWQALNNSVALRHSTFLYIRNLAAPDMLFSFGSELPIVGKYFNLLPFLVVGLQLAVMKVMSPPAVTEEAKMQQSMMKYMMVFMAFMFYRVPSGLGIYFITSSLWSVGERVLLPKITKSKAALPKVGEGGGLIPTVEPSGKAAGGVNGWLAKKLEKLLEEAANERTIRNNAPGNGSGNGRETPPDRNRNRPKPGKRR